MKPQGVGLVPHRIHVPVVWSRVCAVTELSRILCSGRFHSDALKAFFEQNGELVFRPDPFARRPFPSLGRVAENQI